MEVRANPRPFIGARTGRTAGFTLIELLVVVAIIALLISILMPSLKRARDQAKAAVCGAHLGQTCKAESSYQSESNEWIPGSPWTTGYWFLTSAAFAMWNPVLPGFNRFVVNINDHVTPLRAITLGRGAISRNRNELFRQMTQDPYGCPASQEIATPWSSTGPPPGMPTIKAPSHLAMWTILRAGPAMYGRVDGNTRQYPSSAGKPDSVAQSDAWEIVVPTGYMPRHSRLGRESLKVFVADGIRRINDLCNFDYDVGTANRKAIDVATPPSTGGTVFDAGIEYNGLARPYSYRHGSNNRIQAGFFDGHVEGLSLGSDRTPTNYTGRAVHPQYYYPSGSVVQDPTALHMDNIPKGTVLP